MNSICKLIQGLKKNSTDAKILLFEKKLKKIYDYRYITIRTIFVVTRQHSLVI